MGGRKLDDPIEERILIVIDERQAQIVVNDVLRRSLGHFGMSEQRLYLARESEQSRVAKIVERLDAHPIARAEKDPFPLVEKRERPHPIEAFETTGAPSFIGCQQDFGVAIGSELDVMISFELLA